jgi:hypothetical protein
MWDLLEGLLEPGLDILSLFELGTAWRFFLPLLSSLAIVGLVHWRSANGIPAALWIPIVLGGIVIGTIWQVRGRD